MTSARVGAPGSARDNRVDFFRGFALLTIFVNHVPGVMWEHLTSRNYGFSDSAELFVFLAGFASAFAYGRPFLQASALVASVKALRRAGTLYLVHITLTMITVSIFAFAAMGTGDGRYLMQLGIGYFMTQPIETLAGVASLMHQLAYLNILPMYCVILLMLPAMLAIGRRVGLYGLLIVSATLWAIAGTTGFNLPNHPNPGGWQFNPFAWQLIFAIGLAAGLAKAGGRALVAYNPALYTIALVYLFLSFLFVEFQLWHWSAMVPGPFLMTGFDKTFVTLPRLLHLAALVYVFVHAPYGSVFRRIGANNPLCLVGRHSLPIFATGTILSILAQALRLDREPAFLFDTTLIAIGLAMHFALALFLEWWRGASAPAKRDGQAKLDAKPATPPLRPAAEPRPAPSLGRTT
ncbi:OpgC family protein [Aureimonas sp. AU40]|uniref:OpgC family protein n=1 Tax=Aureimonas sp. AU40 TaxID=1637747 RepID=UPI000B203469|nr:OpgC domain-containing protein [Aureimonas sp. AU40]